MAVHSPLQALAYVSGLHGAKSALSTQYAGMLGATPSAEVSLDGTQESTASELVATLHANLALCYLKLGKPERALSFVDKVLETEKKEEDGPLTPLGVKAASRGGQALRELGRFDDAEAMLLWAAKSHTKADRLGKDIRAQLKAVRRARKAEDASFGAGLSFGGKAFGGDEGDEDGRSGATSGGGAGGAGGASTEGTADAAPASGAADEAAPEAAGTTGPS